MLTARARRAARLAAPGVAALALAACSPNADLSRAVDGGRGRAVSAPPPRAPLRWASLRAAAPGNDTAVVRPLSACWSGATLVVADGETRRVRLFDDAGRPAGELRAADPFVDPKQVACLGDGSGVAVADWGAQRVYFFDGRAGAARAGAARAVAAPPMPQGLPFVGRVALGPAGRWFVSWLGADSPLGPYLRAAAWDTVRLVEEYAPDGRRGRAFGRPAVYADPVARRVFNRVYMAARRDTLWVLTQGDATVRAFDRDGVPGPAVLLPVHYRGMEPDVTAREPLGPDTDMRYNVLDYHFNVAGLAAVDDTLLATFRYRDWGRRLVGAGFGTVRLWASSALEVFDHAGRHLVTWDVPGMAADLATDGGRRVAVVTRYRDGRADVLLARLAPGFAGACAAEATCPIAASPIAASPIAASPIAASPIAANAAPARRR